MKPSEDGLHERFEALLSDIRVVWHKDAFVRDRWKVSARTVTSVSQLANFFAPWYRTNDKIGVDHSDENARPMTVAEVARNLDRLSSSRRNRIECFVSTFRACSPPLRFTIPTYEMSAGDQLILDGNHRCVAAMLSSTDIEIEVLSVAGPHAERALSDMRWFLRKETGSQ